MRFTKAPNQKITFGSEPLHLAFVGYPQVAQNLEHLTRISRRTCQADPQIPCKEGPNLFTLAVPRTLSAWVQERVSASLHELARHLQASGA
jgi:hypothetical protein